MTSKNITTNPVVAQFPETEFANSFDLARECGLTHQHVLRTIRGLFADLSNYGKPLYGKRLVDGSTRHVALLNPGHVMFLVAGFRKTPKVCEILVFLIKLESASRREFGGAA